MLQRTESHACCGTVGNRHGNQTHICGHPPEPNPI